MTLALVYRGPASSPGCPESAARLLRAGGLGFRVAYVGPGEEYPLAGATLQSAALYVQPGGDGLRPAWRALRRHAPDLRAFVEAGGRYLGFCLGGYLAGHTPGLGLLDGDTTQYIRSPGADWRSRAATSLTVDWAGESRRLYFQDGCSFIPGPRTEVVARYRNGLAAAVVNPFGAGRVAAVGPHPEATDDWFLDDGIPALRPPATDLGIDLLRRVMA